MGPSLTGRVLLTGATGLIGDQVVRQWPRGGLELVAAGRADGDLLAAGGPERLVERVRPTAVVHLAWSASGLPGYRSSGDNARWYDASLALVQAAETAGAQCWLTGSVVDGVVPTSFDVADEYTAHKTALRRDLEGAIGSGTLGWLRPTYVFDDVRERPALVAQAMSAAASGVPVELRTPDERHDYVHVVDVARAVVLAVTSGLLGLRPIGAGRTRAVSELVEALGAQWTAAPSQVAERHSDEAADIGWLLEQGWRPLHTEALFATMEDER